MRQPNRKASEVHKVGSRIGRRQYADMFGPTTGDLVRLADTELFIEIERDFAEMTGDREQDGRQRRIDEIEIGGGIAGMEVPSLQDLLPGPEPERIILCLSASPDFRNENVGSQRDAADQEKNIERRSQRRISQHAHLSAIRYAEP